jgi:small-conductance mechanosensitive channel
MPDVVIPGINPLVTALFVATVAIGIAFTIRYVALRGLHRWASRTGATVEPVLLESLRLPSLLWCVLLGLYVGVDVTQLPGRINAVALNIVYGLIVFSMTAALAGFISAFLRQGLVQHNLPIPTTGLSIAFVKVSIWLLGLLILLGGLGISITPMLTALGVGGLAVALALQDTLANFFAGLHILMEQQVRVGDFIRLETGQEGHVVDIGWRTTRIRMASNSLVILPNSKVTQSVLTNYHLPEQSMVLTIPFHVSYDADPEVVERVVMEEVQSAVGQVPGLLAAPAPLVRLSPGFGASGLEFTLTCQVQDVTDQMPVQHALRKRLLRRFKQEGIIIPYPQYTVHLQPNKP